MKLTSSDRDVEEKVSLRRWDYVGKVKPLLFDLVDRQQRQCFCDFVLCTTAGDEQEGVNPSQLYAYGLKTNTTSIKK